MKTKIRPDMTDMEIGEIMIEIASKYGLFDSPSNPKTHFDALCLAQQLITDQSDYMTYVEGMAFTTLRPVG